jgi:hypothetical protein
VPVISPTPAMERWTVRVDRTEADFSCAPLVEDHTAARALPRVWAGRGLGFRTWTCPASSPRSGK